MYDVTEQSNIIGNLRRIGTYVPVDHAHSRVAYVTLSCEW